MNAIERQNLTEILDQYIEEVVTEHANMQTYCKEDCVACTKKEIAIAIEKYLEVAGDLKDVALF